MQENLLIVALVGLVVLIVFLVTCATIYDIKKEAKKQTKLLERQLEVLQAIFNRNS
jgi:uncharacterized protein YoxC